MAALQTGGFLDPENIGVPIKIYVLPDYLAPSWISDFRLLRTELLIEYRWIP